MGTRSEATRLLPLRRKARGWSQHELARQLTTRLGRRVYGSMVVRWEGEGRRPELETLLALQELGLIKDIRLWVTPAKAAA